MIKRKQNILSQKEEEEVIKLYQQGLPVYKIVKIFNVSNSTISKVLKENGLPIRNASYYNFKKRVNLTLTEEEEIIKLYQQGLPASKIENMFNVSYFTISEILEKNNLPIRNRYEYVIKKKSKLNVTLTPKEEEEVIKFYQQGVQAYKIAKMFKVSTSTISEVLEKNNIPIRNAAYYKPKKRENLTLTEEEEVIKLYQEGLPSYKIEKMLNANYFTISEVLEKNNIPIRTRYEYIIKKKSKLNITLTPEEEETVIKLYREGLQAYKIGEMFNVIISTITNLLKKNNILIRKRSEYKK